MSETAMVKHSSSLESGLHARLNTLPKKCAGVLRGLWSLNHLDDFSLETILDAGELSRDTSRLTAFATSFVFLRSKGIPISDVIAMSKTQQRKINLWWSPKRWQEQHDRLSRFATLAQLSRDNIQYDLEYFSHQLPSQFTGYLIGSSRRLGMEGLRQRHCVASYHDRILRGLTAICVVFVNQQRWTVELIRNTNEDYPLTIGQIKSRFNQIPAREVRNRVFEILQIREPILNKVEDRYVQHFSTWKENLRRLIPLFDELQIEEIEVEFDGGGDSGSIHRIDLDEEFRSMTVNIVEYSRSFEHGVWTGEYQDTETTLSEAIENLVYDYLEQTGVNWYDGDGGRGNFRIDMLRREIEGNVYVFTVESNHDVCDEFSFDELLEV